MKSMSKFTEEVGTQDLVSIKGSGTRWEIGRSSTPNTRIVFAPVGIIKIDPAEMIVRVGAGTKLADLQSELSISGQEVALDGLSDSTVGGSLAVGSSSFRRFKIGKAADVLLQAECVASDGQNFTAGGPTVKNVTGYDLCRLLVSSLGTLAFIGTVILRTRPKPEASAWFVGSLPSEDVLASCYRPAAVFSETSETTVLLEGYLEDLDAERKILLDMGFKESTNAPILPKFTSPWNGEYPHSGLLEVQSGVLHTGEFVEPASVDSEVKELAYRMKNNFDPTGRLNPGCRPYGI